MEQINPSLNVDISLSDIKKYIIQMQNQMQNQIQSIQETMVTQEQIQSIQETMVTQEKFEEKFESFKKDIKKQIRKLSEANQKDLENMQHMQNSSINVPGVRPTFVAVGRSPREKINSHYMY